MSKKLSTTEKRRIEDLYICERKVQENLLINKLRERRDQLTADLDHQLSCLRQEIVRCEEAREKLIEFNNYQGLTVHSCGSLTHPDLMLFRSETNKHLDKIWRG